VAQKQTESKKEQKHLYFLVLSALGVVYGDIGTSPLYAFRQCFYGDHAVNPTSENVLGVLSLIFWSLMIVISLKYLLVILRADNQGEGGILALMEVVLPRKGHRRAIILIMGLFGAALLYGDGTITPAISVLGAIDGLKVATPFFNPYIIPIALVILFLLFLLQSRGTGKVGILFGPVMIVWFVIIGLTGIIAIFNNPEVLAALNPYHAIKFFLARSLGSFFILGAVFLVVTGGEALYADIGHFGRAPIRLAWFILVLPCLVLNYFGQGALILNNPSYTVNPFYHLTPDWALYPMVILATLATIIASQAIISGAFSLTFQAVQLGYLPRLRILHTSEEERGQIYMPQVNWILFVATVAVVLGFQSSNNLAAAYGVAVSTTMVITTILGFVAMRTLWNWNIAVSILVAGFFLIVDLTFFSANLLKILQGGWYPLLIAAGIYLLISTWIKGREEMNNQIQKYVQPLQKYLQHIDMRKVKKIPGIAIYLSESPLSTPLAFIHNINHNKILHRRVIFISVNVKNVPFVRSEDRLKFQRLAPGFYRVLLLYGFMNRPDVRSALKIVQNQYLKLPIEDSTFYIGREKLIPRESIGMAKWRSRLFVFMKRNSEDIVQNFNIPPERVFEIGAQFKF
jgi:KUP system potassium uptake protein